MALKTATGSKAGPYSTFQVVLELTLKSDTGTGYKMNLRRYIKVVAGTSGFQGTNLTTTWGNVSISGSGNYLVKDTEVTVEYGKTYNTGTQQAYYYSPSSGTTYKSSTSLSYTVPKPIYTVSYDANGGSNAPASQTKTYGTTLALSSSVPTRDGHSFLGWAETSTAEEPQYLSGGSFTKNANTTLYAVWELLTNKVTFDAQTNGGSVEGSGYYEIEVGYNYQLGDLPEATKQNNEFVGWFTNPSGGTKVTGTEKVIAPVTLYAQFKLLANGYIRVNGKYKPCMIYRKVNGKYVGGVSYARAGGRYKQQSN